ncbi:MAG: hypothetical protein KIC61_06610 [Staphylococcus sp.]|nr:hypothetical protein [Staphylococcus sp.]
MKINDMYTFLEKISFTRPSGTKEEFPLKYQVQTLKKYLYYLMMVKFMKLVDIVVVWKQICKE